MKFYYQIFICLFFFSILSCNLKRSTEKRIKNKDSSSLQDLFIREVPIMKNGDTSLEYLDVKKITSQMNLSSLGDGVSDIEIRIWFPDMSMDKLIQIKKDNGVWSGNLYCFDTEFDTTLVGYKVAKLKTIPISPKSGWGNMDQKIIDLEILSIPNMEKVAGTKGKSIDGESYSVEVATSRIYRFYTYDNPKDHKNIPEVNQMVNIIEWFNSEFPDCSSN